MFLDEFQKVLEKNETSVLFKPHLNKMKAIFFEARRNLKKRITAKIQSQQREGEQEQQRTDIMDEDDTTYSNCFRTCKRYQKDIAKRMYLYFLKPCLKLFRSMHFSSLLV